MRNPDLLVTCDAEDHLPRRRLQIESGDYQRAASICRALGEPGRLRLLSLLLEGELCVTELATALCDSLPTVSQRLRLLRAEGVVEYRREGKHMFYRLADSHVASFVSSALAFFREPSRPVVSEE